MIDKVEHEFGRIKVIASYWSLQAYPHFVSTYGISRYAFTSFLLNSVRLHGAEGRLDQNMRLKGVRVSDSRRVGVIHNDSDFFFGALLDPCSHVELDAKY